VNNETQHNARNYTISEYIALIFQYRHMIYTLALRDLRVKYVQSRLGLLWTVIQPISAIALYTFFFTYVFDIQFSEYPYVLYVFSGIIPWTLFSHLLNHGSASLVQNQEIIRKIKFPKIILVLVKALVGVVEVLPALFILLCTIPFLGLDVQWTFLWIPLILILNLMICLIIPILISALTVSSRDAIHIVPYLANFGIWLTPVFWVSKDGPDFLRILADLNPLTFILSLYRWALFGSVIQWSSVWSCAAALVILLPIGFLIFKRREKYIIDEI